MSKKMSLKELDFNNMGAWPREAKIGFCVIIAIVIIGLSWYLFVSDKKVELAALETTEQKLRKEYAEEQGKAANLEPLTAQLAQMEQQLQQMLRQLPSKTEMPDLIVDISQTALATGISNELFEPGAEEMKEFYAEKPIALRMVGSYHQFGAYVSGVASLPRVVIMTMHDIALKPRGDAANSVGIVANSPLELSGTVKTYRYLDEDEIAQAAPATDATAATPPAGG